MRYEDVYRKTITVTDPTGNEQQLRVVGYSGHPRGGDSGVTLQVIDEPGWRLGGDQQLVGELRKAGWKIPTIELTDFRRQEMSRLAGRLGQQSAPTPPPSAAPTAESIVDSLLETGDIVPGMARSSLPPKMARSFRAKLSGEARTNSAKLSPKPKCSGCNRRADYFNGFWRCDRCYPRK